MPTITVTSAEMALMKCTEAVAAHLLVVAHGRPTNRAFTVPRDRTVRQYANAQTLRQNALGPVGLIMQGKLPPSAMAPAGQRLPDYTLIPVNGYTGRPGAADHFYSALLRYVEQAARQAGPHASPTQISPLLEPGVPCDILCLRPRRVSSWFTGGYPRLSQLMAQGFAARYPHLHCLLLPAVRPSSRRKKSSRGA